LSLRKAKEEKHVLKQTKIHWQKLATPLKTYLGIFVEIHENRAYRIMRKLYEVSFSPVNRMNGRVCILFFRLSDYNRHSYRHHWDNIPCISRWGYMPIIFTRTVLKAKNTNCYYESSQVERKK